MENKAYEIQIYDTGKETNHKSVSLIIGDLDEETKKYVDKEAERLRTLDKMVQDTAKQESRYLNEKASSRWWDRLDKLDNFLEIRHLQRKVKENSLEMELTGQDSKLDPLIHGTEKADESLSVSFGNDPMGDDDDQLSVTGLTAAQKDFVKQEALELRYLDRKIDDDVRDGDIDGVKFWQEQYSSRLSSLQSYMERRGIQYNISNRKDMRKERKDAMENQEVKEKADKHVRRVAVMRKRQKRSQSRGMGRSLERTSEQ